MINHQATNEIQLRRNSEHSGSDGVEVASVVSNSVRPHRQQPTRLLCPWDSPGKSTGVGCHFLLQCMRVKSESEVTHSCPSLSDPMDCSLPGSSVHGIFQTRVLEWGAIAFSTQSIELSLFIKNWNESDPNQFCFSKKKYYSWICQVNFQSITFILGQFYIKFLFTFINIYSLTQNILKHLKKSTYEHFCCRQNFDKMIN